VVNTKKEAQVDWGRDKNQGKGGDYEQFIMETIGRDDQKY
jgi:hypothetical protein